MTRNQRRRKRLIGPINSIIITCEPGGHDVIWIIFNALCPPSPRRHDFTEKLSLHTWADEGKGEAYVSQNFPGVSYKVRRLAA